MCYYDGKIISNGWQSGSRGLTDEVKADASVSLPFMFVSASHSLTCHNQHSRTVSLSVSINFKSSSCQQNILVLSALITSPTGSEDVTLYDFRPKHQQGMCHLYKQIFIPNINEIIEAITEDKQEMRRCMFLQRGPLRLKGLTI